MTSDDVLTVVFVVAFVSSCALIGLLMSRMIRRTPEEVERTNRAYRQVELTGNLQKALENAEGLPGVDLIATFESVLKSNARTLPEDETKQLRDRLAAIEGRFPDEATVDKIASANDGILATKVEGLEREVKRLEDKTLDRWDVAQVFAGLLTLVAAVVGIVVGVIRFL